MMRKRRGVALVPRFVAHPGRERAEFLGKLARMPRTLRDSIQPKTTMKARTKMATRSAKPRAPRTITVKATKSGAAARKMRSAKPVPVVVPMSLGRAGSAVRDGIVTSLTTLTRIEGEIVVLVRSAVSGPSVPRERSPTNWWSWYGMWSPARYRRPSRSGRVDRERQEHCQGRRLGVHEVGGDIATAAAETVKTVIRHAAAVGADVSSVARGAVDGIVEATAETGGNVGRVATAAVRGAIKAAGEVGTHRPNVADVLAGAVRGVKGVRGATVHKAAKAPRKKAAKKPAKKPAKKSAKKATRRALKK